MITIFSLTDKGNVLADKLALELNAEHMHKPANFVQQVREKFSSGNRLILICAMGIAVRSIAPVLKDKYHDPAVLVMDEEGKFIIPLVSGHEGGANEWGRQIANLTNGQVIITGPTTYTEPVYVAGIGCERNCPLDFIQSLIEGTLRVRSMSKITISAISSIDIKKDEPAILELADQMNIPFVTYPAEALRTVEDQLSTKSDIVFREVGVYGVAESAALLHAKTLTGNEAELVIPKHKNTKATFALARSYLNT